MKRAIILSVWLLALTALSCGQVPTAEVPQSGSTPVPAKVVAATPVPPTPAWPAAAQPAVDLVLTTVAEMAPEEDIEVVKVEAVEWRDGCLECSGPGEGCADVMVPGYRVVVRVAGQEYEYHTDKGQKARLCAVQGGAEDWGAAQPLVEKAITDLVKRLGVPAEAITVVKVEEKQWSDSSIGCPQPGQAYLTVIVPGYQILLEAGGRKYDYHADKKGTVFLCENATQ